MLPNTNQFIQLFIYHIMLKYVTTGSCNRILQSHLCIYYCTQFTKF